MQLGFDNRLQDFLVCPEQLSNSIELQVLVAFI